MFRFLTSDKGNWLICPLANGKQNIGNFFQIKIDFCNYKNFSVNLAGFPSLHLIVKEISVFWKCKILGWQRVIQSLVCILQKKLKFSTFFAAGNVSSGGTSATQRQKFHTDDANQCLHNKSGSHGVPNINLSNFACLLVDFGEVLCSSAKELQQNSNASCREDYVPQILTILLQILRVLIWPLWTFIFCLSFVSNS